MLQALQDYWMLPIVISSLILSLFINFVYGYWLPARKLKASLNQSVKSVLEIKGIGQKDQYKILLDKSFQKVSFTHAWKMFGNTLHDSFRTHEGEDQLVSSKATVSSEYFFNQSIIVDTPLKIEFFKHLPSIMTGIGIIGTFSGLLLGLWQFDPGGDPANVTSSLKLLLRSVTEAFFASGVAIAAAMFVTWKEKSLLRTCYAMLEELNTAIDSLFDADDVGEEYLAKLIKSAEENATQTKQLKDSLVEDLKTMMTNLVAENQKNQQELAQRLAQSYQESGSDMAAKIGESITSGLQVPLEKIASSVSQVSSDQGTAVQGLLENVLINFTDKLESTFGGQMKGMGDMLSQSVTAMGDMQTGISNLISDMRQSSLGVNDKIGEMMTNITVQRLEHDRVVAENQNVLHQKTIGFVNGLSDQIAKLLEESRNSITAANENLIKLTDVSLNSINGMNEGAEKMRIAADRFTTAGNLLNNVTEGSTALLTQVNTLSSTLVNTTTGLSTLLADYKQTRDLIGTSIETLERHIEQAKRESSLSGQMLNDVQAITNSLAKVREDMVEYLGQVNDVLATSMTSFNKVVVGSLHTTLGEFDTALAKSVSRLTDGMGALSNVAEDINDAATDLVKNANRFTHGQ